VSASRTGRGDLTAVPASRLAAPARYATAPPGEAASGPPGRQGVTRSVITSRPRRLGGGAAFDDTSTAADIQENLQSPEQER
jgi:hypothetical protein